MRRADVMEARRRLVSDVSSSAALADTQLSMDATAVPSPEAGHIAAPDIGNG